MTEPLDDIAFLANSPNRVAVLETLATGPHHRDELLASLDLSRVTLARVLSDFESRQWIDRCGQECQITPLGEWIAGEFDELLATLADEQRLRDVISYVPTDQLPFGVRCLRDADLVGPSTGSMWAHVRRSATCFRSATQAQVLSSQVAPPVLEAITDAIDDHDQQFVGVLTRDVVDTVIADPAMEPLFCQLLESPRATIYVSETELPLTVFVTDETVGLPLTDADNVVRVLLLTENDRVHEWATMTIDRYCDRAAPITPETLPA